MRTKRDPGIWLRCLAGSLLLSAASAAAEEIVIANLSVGTEAIAAGELESIFLGKSTRIGGERVEIAVLSDGVTHADFLTSYVRKNPKQFLSHWRKICFTGKGSMPVTFVTEPELVA